jgi:hypothetical protein
MQHAAALPIPPLSLLPQLHEAAAPVLLPVMPHLTSELQAKDAQRRLDAVSVLGGLFSGPQPVSAQEGLEQHDSGLLLSYGDVLLDLLGRFTDQAVRGMLQRGGRGPKSQLVMAADGAMLA